MKSIIVILVSLFSINTIAAPAMSFKCSGIENINDNAIAIDLKINYSDWDSNSGYANQVIKATYPDGTKQDNEINLAELRESALNTECLSLNELEAITAPSGFEYFRFEIKNNCEGNKVNTLAYCEKSL